MWIVIGLVAICIIVIAALLIFPGSLAGPTAPPLQLPQLSAATTSITSLDGTWMVASGSVAGFRVNESFLTQSSVIVGRTNAVAGSLVVSNSEISSGTFQADLSQLTMGGKPYPSLLQILDTNTYPDVTLTLTTPVTLAGIVSNGQPISSNAAGLLTIDGTTHPVKIAFTASYNGSVLEAIGTAPITASDWGIKSPFGIHDDDTIEFLIISQRD